MVEDGEPQPVETGQPFSGSDPQVPVGCLAQGADPVLRQAVFDAPYAVAVFNAGRCKRGSLQCEERDNGSQRGCGTQHKDRMTISQPWRYRQAGVSYSHMRLACLLMFLALDERTAGLVNQIADSGQIVEIATPAS